MHSGGWPSVGCALKAWRWHGSSRMILGPQMWRDAHVLLRVIWCASQLDGQRSYKHSCHKWESALGRRQAGEADSTGTCLQALMKVLISGLQNLQGEQPLQQTLPVTHSSLTTYFSNLLSPSRQIQGGRNADGTVLQKGGFLGPLAKKRRPAGHAAVWCS